MATSERIITGQLHGTVAKIASEVWLVAVGLGSCVFAGGAVDNGGKEDITGHVVAAAPLNGRMVVG